MTESRRYRGLLIGNADYPRDPHALPALEGPLTDIVELRNALADEQVGLFDSADLEVLPDYGIHDLRERVDELFTTATRGDVLLLYYSGHGQLDERGTLYLCARDTRTAALRATALSAIEINNILDGSPATSILIVLDCCYSGAFKGATPTTPVAGRGRYVLTSSRSTQLAQAATRPGQPSPFTRQLVRALRSAPSSAGAEHLTVVEIYRQVHHWMTADAVIAPQLRFAGEGDVALARRPAPPPAAPPQSAEPPSAPLTRAPPPEKPRPSGEPLARTDTLVVTFPPGTRHSGTRQQSASAQKPASPRGSASPSRSAERRTTGGREGRDAPPDAQEPARKPVPRRAILALGGVLVAGGATAVALLPGNDGGESGDGATKETASPTAKKVTVKAAGTLHCPDNVTSVAFSPDGPTVATNGGYGNARLWNMETEKNTRTLTNLGNVFSVAFSPDGEILATGGDNHKAELWNAKTGKRLHTLTGHSDAVASVAFSPQGKTLATGGHDGEVRLWNVATGKSAHTFQGLSKGAVSVAFSPDGGTLAIGIWDGRVLLANLKDKHSVVTLKGHTDAVTAVDFSPDGKTLATGSYDSSARLWNLETRKTLHTFTNRADAVSSVAFSPDSKLLAADGHGATARLWNVETGKPVQAFTKHTAPVRAVAFHPDRRILATGSDDKTVRLWRVS
ncbi:caspase family protein [Streptomyces diacarni]|uniref:caspase, EACC1-associated type n=1 Tax=Streptomyces diacarni TaxID=2800381 RepID=UPI003406D19E